MYGKQILDFWTDVWDLCCRILEICEGFWGPYLEDDWEDVRWFFIQCLMLLGVVLGDC